MAVKKKAAVKNLDRLEVFKILADANRFRAIEILSRAGKKGVSVSDLSDELKMNHSAASHLLGYLHAREIVIFKKEGRAVCYAFAATPVARKLVKLQKLD